MHMPHVRIVGPVPLPDSLKSFDFLLSLIRPLTQQLSRHVASVTQSASGSLLPLLRLLLLLSSHLHEVVGLLERRTAKEP